MKKKLLITLLVTSLAGSVQADEYVYTYCIIEDISTPALNEQLVVLSFNLSSAEIALHLGKDGEYRWFAGRRPQSDTGFSVDGDLEDLNTALRLRDSVSRQEYFRSSSEDGVTALKVNEPLPCEEVIPDE